MNEEEILELYNKSLKEKNSDPNENEKLNILKTKLKNKNNLTEIENINIINKDFEEAKIKKKKAETNTGLLDQILNMDEDNKSEFSDDDFNEDKETIHFEDLETENSL